ncbi:hypothetical protein EDE11_11032 [Methylomonas methanica]|uniref:Uncharacterized protein n=1 Tax=Methylomonas methanica TaxID=421 RepID=A0ABY2CL03_METMH|nr:hypothetical protein EDE11_11032 [Methylomonas methanica]
MNKLLRMKITLFERFALISWVVVVVYLFAVFRDQTHPDGTLDELLKLFFSSLSAAYLQ